MRRGRQGKNSKENERALEDHAVALAGTESRHYKDLFVSPSFMPRGIWSEGDQALD
jgi:hypothetical protein